MLKGEEQGEVCGMYGRDGAGRVVWHVWKRWKKEDQYFRRKAGIYKPPGEIRRLEYKIKIYLKQRLLWM